MALNSTSESVKRRSWMSYMWFFETFLGVVALIVSGLIGATITFALMHVGLPKNWFSIGYNVGLGTMKKPKKIPPRCLDIFYQAYDFGLKVRPKERWCLKCGSKLGENCGDAEPDFNRFYCSIGCYQNRKNK